MFWQDQEYHVGFQTRLLLLSYLSFFLCGISTEFICEHSQFVILLSVVFHSEEICQGEKKYIMFTQYLLTDNAGDLSLAMEKHVASRLEIR